jgi:DNA-binding NarL/FixJ family response regulator
MAIRLVLVDDQPIVMHGLEHLLPVGPEFEVLPSSHVRAAGLDAIDSFKPDVVVVDPRRPGSAGLAVLRQLKPKAVPLVVLMASQNEDDWLDAARCGARAVVLKSMAARVLEHCVRAVHAGGCSVRVHDAGRSGRAIAQRRSSNSALGRLLTARELEIVKLVAAGLENHEIASRLSISIGTTKIHLHHVYDKLHLDGRHDLLRYMLIGR